MDLAKELHGNLDSTVGKTIEIHIHVCCYPNGKNWQTGTFSS